MKSIKSALDFDLYEKYHIDQRYQAYVIHVESIDQNQCDDLEARYIEQGYKVFHVSMERNTEGAFDLDLIVAKLDLTF